MTDHEELVRLSCVLTGMTEEELPAMTEQRSETGVSVKLYEIYLERLRTAYPAELDELLGAWRSVQDKPDPEKALSETLADKARQRLRVAARQVIKIWYLSTIDDPRIALDPKQKGRNSGQLGGDLGQYQLSAIWRLIGAPVPGYSNFPHGYWQDKPEILELT